MIKKLLLYLILGVITIGSGCGKNVTSEKSNIVNRQENDKAEVEKAFPRTCNIESKSGKVKFNCTLELPESLNGRNYYQKTSVEGCT